MSLWNGSDEMNIPLMRPWTGEEEKAAVANVLDSGWLTEGEVVAEFEETVAKYVGVKHAIAVPSGAMGLDLVMGLVSWWDDVVNPVIVPDFTHPATVNCVIHHRLCPVLVDVDPVTRCVDSLSLEKAATCYLQHERSHVAAVLVSWGGRPVPNDVWDQPLCGCDNPTIEDCACSLGARQSNGSMVGSFANASVFSFHPRKVITTGEGGMIVTDDGGLASELRVMKDFGWDNGCVECPGYNMKMSDINAAVGLVQMGKIEQIITERNKMASIYDELLRDVEHATSHVPLVGDERQTYQSYCITIDNPSRRDALIRDLRKSGIEAQIGTYALHQQPLYAMTVERCGDLHNSLMLYHQLLTLPMYHGLEHDDQERVVSEIEMLLKHYVRMDDRMR